MKKVSEKSLFSIVGSIKQHSLFIFLTTIVAVINLFFSFSSLWNKLNGYVIFWLVFSIIIISALLYKLVDVWNKYQIYNKFANNVHSFMKDTVLTDVEFLSKLEKEDDRFVSFTFQYKIKDFPIKFNLLIDCLIAKCEDICYYIKTLGNSYTLFYVKLYSLVKNAKGPKEEYIEKVSNMLTEMDFLECIFKDFSTGVNEDV